MTGIIIGLLAALGIGGGIALSGHGGGGGGNDSGYVEPVQPGKKPSIVSLLASADKYQHVQSVSDYDGPSIGNGIFTVTGERPLVENGRFKTDESEGEIEDLYVPYTTTIGLENYSHSDAYADYYKKDSFITKGLYNTKEYPDDADNWVEKEETTQDILALGGQVLGLKNSEFGYHNNNSLNSLGGELPYYKPFYMYDNTKLASTTRTDTALYKGNVLGYVEASNTLQETLGTDIHPITGNVNLNIDFANKTLNGNINTKISGQNWYGFNVSGQLNTLNDFSIGSVSIDDTQTPNSALSKYNMTNIMSGGGGGKLLEDELQKELIGKLWLYGNNQDYLIHSDISFGAIDNSIPPGENPGMGDSSGDIIPSIPTDFIPNDTLISSITSLEILPYNQLQKAPSHITRRGNAWFQIPTHLIGLNVAEGKFILNTRQPAIENGHFLFSGDGLAGTKYPVQSENTVILDATNWNRRENDLDVYMHSDSFTGNFEEQGLRTVIKNDYLFLAGKQMGLTVSEFGVWKQEVSGWNDPSFDFWEGSPFFSYDTSHLLNSPQNDIIALKGLILSSNASPGDLNLNINLANKILNGAFSIGLLAVDFAGYLPTTNSFIINTVQNAVILGDSSISGSVTNAKISGEGVVLYNQNTLEVVGKILFSGDHIQKTETWYSFGAKEVK